MVVFTWTYCLNSASANSSSTMVLFLFFLGIREWKSTGLSTTVPTCITDTKQSEHSLMLNVLLIPLQTLAGSLKLPCCWRASDSCFYLEVFGKALSVILLVEPLRIQGSPHLQDLEVSFQLLSDLRRFHIKPAVSCGFVPLCLGSELFGITVNIVFMITTGSCFRMNWSCTHEKRWVTQ